MIWSIFDHLTSQSRAAGMGGFIGFDYGALPVLFDAYEVPVNERIFMLDKIAILTRVASRHWNTDKAKDAGK